MCGVHCTTCRDWFPDHSGSTMRVCDHVWWCVKCDMWGGDCGDPCGCLTPDGWVVPQPAPGRSLLWLDIDGRLRGAVFDPDDPWIWDGMDGDYCGDGWWWVMDPSLSGMAGGCGSATAASDLIKPG